jgi:hypothetical protein
MIARADRLAVLLIVCFLVSGCSDDSSSPESYSKLAAALKQDFPDICVEKNATPPKFAKYMNCTPGSPQSLNFFISSVETDTPSELVTQTVRFSANIENTEFQKHGDFYRKTVGKLRFGDASLAAKFNNLQTLVSACFETRPGDIRCQLKHEDAKYPAVISVQKGISQTTTMFITYERAAKSAVGAPPTRTLFNRPIATKQ